jgi:hypothetical protein
MVWILEGWDRLEEARRMEYRRATQWDDQMALPIPATRRRPRSDGGGGDEGGCFRVGVAAEGSAPDTRWLIAGRKEPAEDSMRPS